MSDVTESNDPPLPTEEAAQAVAAPPKGALLAIFLIVLSDLMGFGLIIPALPFYARTYNASDFQVGLLFSIYSLCQLIAAPVLGLMSDKLGRRPVLVFSQAGSVLGYLLLALATARHWPSATMGLGLVYLSRVIDGFSGGNIATAQAYVSDVTPPEKRARGMGMLGAAFGIGFSIGPAVGGLLAAVHPSAPALASAAFSFLAATMTVVYLKEPVRHSKRPEGEGAQLWLHPSRFAPILKNRVLAQLMGISFFSMMAFVMMEAVFAIFLNDRFGFRELQVGIFFGLAGIVIIIVQGGLIGRLTRRFGEWPLVVAGPLLVMAAMAFYGTVGATSPAQLAIVPGVMLVLFGGLFNAGGRSIQTPTLSSLVSQSADPDRQGATFGLYHMLSSLARVIGPVVATAFYTAHMTAPFWIAGAIMLAMAFWTISLRRRVRSAAAIGRAGVGHGSGDSVHPSTETVAEND